MKHKPFVQEKPSRRPTRFAERVREELSDILPLLKDPRVSKFKMITITYVDVSPDLKNGHAHFSVMGMQKGEREISELEQGLNKASIYIKKELMQRLQTKNTPVLIFKYDRGLDYSSEMQPLYKKIKDERATRNNEEE